MTEPASRDLRAALVNADARCDQLAERLRAMDDELVALRTEAHGLRATRSLKADWLVDQVCRAAEIDLRADVRKLLVERVEKALNPELPL